jgi:hypothetical protein
MSLPGCPFCDEVSQTGNHPQEKNSQIWLHVREESKNIYESCYILVTCCKLTYCPIMVSSEFFPLVTMVLFIFLLPSGENSPPKNAGTPWF